MPIINTNDPALHRKIKKFAGENDTTIGKTYEMFARLGLKLGLSERDVLKILESNVSGEKILNISE